MMPTLLEVGLLCQKFHVAPSHFGFEDADPRLSRSINTLVGIYDTAISQASAKDKAEWHKNNPSGVDLLSFARGGESKNPDPLEVKIVLPERPRGRR